MKTKVLTWKTGTRFMTAMLIVAVFAFMFAQPAFAGEYVEGDYPTIGPDEVIDDDLFIAGQIVKVEGTVKGDLFAVGQEIIISGIVEGNIYASGQSIVFSGETDGTIHVGGYSLELKDGAYVARNLFFGGFGLQLEEGAMISRNVYTAGYQAVINGEVERDVTASVGAFEVNGYVGGDVRAEVGEPQGDVPDFQIYAPGMPTTLEFAEPGCNVTEDNVGGDLDCRVIPVNVDVNFDTPDFEIDPAYFVVQAARRRLGEFLSLMLIGGLLLYFAKDWFEKVVGQVKENVAANAGWGLLVFLLYVPVVMLAAGVLIFVVIFIWLITVGNLGGTVSSLGFLALSGTLSIFGLLVGYVTKAVVGYIVGRWLLGRSPSITFDNFWQHFFALALGVFLYEILRAIPVIGFFAMIVVVLIGTGALFLMIRNRARPPQEADLEAA